jgi:hypothetical protein
MPLEARRWSHDYKTALPYLFFTCCCLGLEHVGLEHLGCLARITNQGLTPYVNQGWQAWSSRLCMIACDNNTHDTDCST